MSKLTSPLADCCLCGECVNIWSREHIGCVCGRSYCRPCAENAVECECGETLETEESED